MFEWLLNIFVCITSEFYSLPPPVFSCVFRFDRGEIIVWFDNNEIIVNLQRGFKFPLYEKTSFDVIRWQIIILLKQISSSNNINKSILKYKTYRALRRARSSYCINKSTRSQVLKKKYNNLTNCAILCDEINTTVVLQKKRKEKKYFSF